MHQINPDCNVQWIEVIFSNHHFKMSTEKQFFSNNNINNNGSLIEAKLTTPKQYQR
jgi:hypothetical protein